MNFKRSALSPGLYLVATPIGAARDITLRALDVLASADVVAAEDTRTARKLMQIHGVPLDGRSVIALHDHSDAAAIRGLVARIAEGAALAYVSEAGTPLISDPGYELARAVREAGLAVHTAPGPVAAVAALTLSGLPTDRFAFAGFLSSSAAQRRAALTELRDWPGTLIFYESPRRLGAMLTDSAEILGPDRSAAVCREITKAFEEVVTGTLETLAGTFTESSARGEIVVVIGRAVDDAVADADVDTALGDALRSMRVKDAATAVAGALGLPRRQVYQRALELARKDKE